MIKCTITLRDKEGYLCHLTAFGPVDKDTTEVLLHCVANCVGALPLSELPDMFLQDGSSLCFKHPLTRRTKTYPATMETWQETFSEFSIMKGTPVPLIPPTERNDY